MTGGTPDPHALWDELAAGSALHALQPADEAQYQEHRAICSRCQEAEAELGEIAAALAHAVEPVEPPPQLRAAILAAAAEPERAQQEPALGPAPMRPATEVSRAADRETPTPLRPVSSGERPLSGSRRWQRWTVQLAAAVLVAALAGGVLSWFRGSADQDTGTAAVQRCQQDPVCRSLPLAATDGQRGTAIVRGQSVVLVLDGLRRNDPSRDSYVLWQEQRTGSVLAVGTFDVLQPVTTTGSLPLRDGDQAVALAITLEPGRAAPASPTGPILASATL